MSTLLSTSHVAAGERAAYWIDMICDVFVQLDCTRTAERFHGEIADQTLGPLRVSRVDSNKQLVLRSPRQIARSCDDYFLVSLQLAGHGRVLQDGRAALLGPGDFALYDSTRCYSLAFDDEFTQLVLKTPRSLLTDRLARAETCTALAIRGSAGMGRVAAELLRSVAREAHTLLPYEIERMAHAVIDVFAAAFGQSPIQQPVSPGSHRAAQLLRIKMFIEDHLRDPELSPEQVARAHGISTRYLSKLFESAGTSAGRFIWDQRLARIERDLGNASLAGRSISDIAFGWGFNDMSHFSRAFRARFGDCPRSYRAHLRH
jgi:AraC-like DNA-binding protein